MDLVAFLANHPWIRSLVLSNNFISDESVKSLSFCVAQTKREAAKQTQQYCQEIVDAVTLLLVCEGATEPFPHELADIVLEYVHKNPVDGLQSVILFGNSLNPTFSACFRNTQLLSEDMLRRISLIRSKY